MQSWMRNVGTAALLALVACDSNPNVPPARTAAGGAASSPVGPATAASDGAVKETSITWRKPDAWTVVAHPSPMRLATYKIPKADGDADDGELTVSRAGGDVQSNIGRWVSQFDGASAPKTSERTAGDLKVTVVEVEGTFKGMAMPGAGPAAPKEGYALLAAIVEGGGSEAHFFKLTGPKKTVDAARQSFDELVGSLAKR